MFHNTPIKKIKYTSPTVLFNQSPVRTIAGSNAFLPGEYICSIPFSAQPGVEISCTMSGRIFNGSGAARIFSYNATIADGTSPSATLIGIQETASIPNNLTQLAYYTLYVNMHISNSMISNNLYRMGYLLRLERTTTTASSTGTNTSVIFLRSNATVVAIDATRNFKLYVQSNNPGAGSQQITCDYLKVIQTSTNKVGVIR